MHDLAWKYLPMDEPPLTGPADDRWESYVEILGDLIEGLCEEVDEDGLTQMYSASGWQPPVFVGFVIGEQSAYNVREANSDGPSLVDLIRMPLTPEQEADWKARWDEVTHPIADVLAKNGVQPNVFFTIGDS